MNIKSVNQMISVEGKLSLRNFMGIFFSLFFPSLMLILFGGIYGNEPNEMFNNHGVLDVSLPAYSVIIICVTGIMNLPLAMANYRERKVLKRFMATPVSPSLILFSQVVVNFLLSIAGMIILAAVGKLAYDLKFLGDFWPVAFAFVLSTFASFSMGFVIASVAPNMKSATAIANILYYPMLFLTGATVPLETMPDTMKKIADFLPMTHAVKLLKGVWLGENLGDYMTQIYVLAATLVVGIIISVFTFRWE